MRAILGLHSLRGCIIRSLWLGSAAMGCGDGVGRPLLELSGAAGASSGAAGAGGAFPLASGGFGALAGFGAFGNLGPGGSPFGGTGNEVPSTPHCAHVADWPAEFAALENELFGGVNAVRAIGSSCTPSQGGRVETATLTLAPALRCAARLHARDMAERDYVSHQNLEGQGPAERIALARQPFSFAGEVIVENTSAAGPSAPEALQQIFAAGGPDCETLTSAEYSAAGVGYYGGRWVLDFTGP